MKPTLTTMKTATLKRILFLTLFLLPVISGLCSGATEGRKATKIGNRYYLSINDAAVLLEATKFWNGETKKAVLNVQGARVRITVGSPIVALGENTYVLPAPVLFVKGVPFIPVELFSEILPDLLDKKIIWDPGTQSLSSLREGLVGVRVSIQPGDEITFVTIESQERIQYSFISSTREVFALLLENGALIGRPAAAKGGLVSELSASAAARGVELRLSLADGTLGYSVKRETEPERIVISFTSSAEVSRGAEYSPLGIELARGDYRVVVIDPGHGGADEGVKGPASVEKDINLVIARQVAEILATSGAVRVVLTRQDDSKLEPDERVARAYAAEGDLFVSIHCDGYAAADARGYSVEIFESDEVFGYSSSGRPDAMIPWDQVAGRHVSAGASLARAISRSLGESGGLRDAGFRRTPLGLFQGLDMPAVLVVCGFLTNPEDEALLREPAGQRKIAGAIARGISEFVSEAQR